MDPDSPAHRKRRSPCCGCLGCGCGVPALALLILFILYTANNRPPNIVIPTPTPPPNNAWNDFLAAARVIRTIPHKAPASMTNPPTTRAGLLAETALCTKEAAPGLAIMRSGFGKPCLAPPQRTYADLVIQDLAAFREVERTTTGVRLYYQLTNQPLKAADAALDGEEMAVMMPRGGTLITSLVGIACEAISLSRFEPLLPNLSKAELARVADRLDVIAAKRVPWSDIILEEGRASTAMLQATLRDPKNQGFKANFETVQALMGGSNGKPPSFQEALDAMRFMFADKNAMLREHLHYFEQLAQEGKGPYVRTSKVKLPNNLFTQIVGPISSQGRAKWQASDTILTLLRIEVALYRFKADHGFFPATLDLLSPVYLKSIPLDPFGSGKSLHYARTKAAPGFLLYSVGSDRTDNGGRAGRYPDDQGFDIVAGWLGSRRKEY